MRELVQLCRGFGTDKGAILLGVALVILLLPGSASAQSAPPICDQYPELPVCDAGTGGGPPPGTDADEDDTVAGGAPGAGTGGPGSGKLPFTGLPLTPLVLLILILLLIGLTLRAWVAYQDRRAAARATATLEH